MEAFALSIFIILDAQRYSTCTWTFCIGFGTWKVLTINGEHNILPSIKDKSSECYISSLGIALVIVPPSLFQKYGIFEAPSKRKSL